MYPRMRKLVISLLAATMILAAAGPAVAAERSVNEAIEIHTKYFNLRDRLLGCKLDRVWNHLSSDRRKGCKTLGRRYVLYTVYGESSDFQIHCVSTRRCLKTPERMPPANKPIPRGAKIYR